MKRSWKSGIVMFALLGLLSCGGSDGDGGVFDPPIPDEPDPVPGFLNVRLTTPNTNDGALLFSLSGGSMDSLRTSGLTIFGTLGSTSGTGLVAGNVGSGTVAQFWVPDVADVSQYSAALQQAAARSTYEQQSLSGYSLTVAR